MLLNIDTSCVQCGACVAVCPVMIIRMNESVPVIDALNEKKCIACGHCVAVCGKAALHHADFPDEATPEIKEENRVSPLQSEQLLRSVRSVRNYSSRLVAPEVVREIANVAHYVPTARNTQGVKFVAVMNPERVQTLTEKVIECMEKAIDAEEAWSMPYRGMVRFQRRSGKDMIFRGAPQLLIALAHKDNYYGIDNARLSTVYARTHAASLGVGTCWAGFFEIYAKQNSEEVAALLGCSSDMRVGAAIMMGYGKYTYRRMVDRRPLDLQYMD